MTRSFHLYSDSEAGSPDLFHYYDDSSGGLSSTIISVDSDVDSSSLHSYSFCDSDSSLFEISISSVDSCNSVLS